MSALLRSEGGCGLAIMRWAVAGLAGVTTLGRVDAGKKASNGVFVARTAIDARNASGVRKFTNVGMAGGAGDVRMDASAVFRWINVDTAALLRFQVGLRMTSQAIGIRYICLFLLSVRGGKG